MKLKDKVKNLNENSRKEILTLSVFIFALIIFLWTNLNSVKTSLDLYIIFGVSIVFLVSPFVLIIHFRRLAKNG